MRRASSFLGVAVGLLALAALAACSASSNSGAATSSAGSAGQQPPQGQPISTPPPSFTITASIQEFSASSGRITLDQTLEGFNVVALTDETAVYGPDGEPFEPKGLRAGMSIEAEGTAAGSGSLNAARIRVVSIPAAKAAPIEVNWARVQIPEGALSLEIPQSWARRGIEWAWDNPAAPGQIVAVNWNDRTPGWEITAMLPNHSVNKDAHPLPEVGWGQANAHTVEVYDSAAGGGTLSSVQMHVLVLAEKRAYDFYASAKSQGELEALKPIVLHMASAAQQSAAASDAAGKVVNDFIKAVQAHDVDKAMSFWSLDRPDQPKGYAADMKTQVSTWAQEQPHWAIAGPTGYTGPVAPKDYRPLDESDPRVERATVAVRLGNLGGAFALLKVDGRWLITGWMQP